MKRIVFSGLLTAALVLHAAPARCLEDKRLAWGRADTNLHMTAAFASSLTATELLKWKKVSKGKATLISSLLVTAGGLFKEFVIDKQASGSDLMANSIGVGGNAIFQYTVRF